MGRLTGGRWKGGAARATQRAVHPHSSIRTVLAAGLLALGALLQAGCGVLHCIEGIADAGVDLPACHGNADDGDDRTSHAPGGGSEECCRILPIEPPSSVASALPALDAPVAVRAPIIAARAPARPVSIAGLTGPPSALAVASPIPLRV